MKRLVSLRDIIRLYHTKPIPERILKRPDWFIDEISNLQCINKIEKLRTKLIYLSKHNVWIKMHVLPHWLVTKLHISEQELMYEDCSDIPLVIDFSLLHTNMQSEFRNSESIYEKDGVRIYTREKSVIVEKEKGKYHAGTVQSKRSESVVY